MPLKVVGDGPLATLVQKAAAADPSIEWLQHLPLSGVYALIERATVLIVPSLWYEHFPRVIAEALAKGTPVVASKASSLREIIASGPENHEAAA